MRRWAVLLALAGCYGPSFQPGLPCSEDGSCPGDQICDPSQTPPTCVATLGDAGVDTDGLDGPSESCATGCSGPASICDLATQTCRGCIADSECSSDVCHELTGECIPEGHALYVAPGGTGNNCTRTAPCGRFNDANNQLTAVRNTIKVADGRYTDRLELKAQNGATTIILSGPDRSWAGPEFVAGLSGTRVDQGVTAVLEGVSLVASTGPGLDAAGSVTLSHVLISNSRDNGVTSRGSLTRIFDSRIETSGARGVVINNGVGMIERTVIVGNTGGGIAIENGSGYSVINTIIANNGATDQPSPGVRFSSGSSPVAVFQFNTVARNHSDLSSVTGIECNRPVTIVSSIVANPSVFGQTEMSPMCSAQSSLFEQAAPPGNLTGNPMFVSATDFHVLPGSPAVNAASPMGAPAVDVDGDPRTGADLPDVGADEVP